MLEGSEEQLIVKKKKKFPLAFGNGSSTKELLNKLTKGGNIKFVSPPQTQVQPM